MAGERVEKRTTTAKGLQRKAKGLLQRPKVSWQEVHVLTHEETMYQDTLRKTTQVYHRLQTLALLECAEKHQAPEQTYREVVAPPINNGIFMASLSISLATNIISSREGVMSPDRPIMSII